MVRNQKSKYNKKKFGVKCVYVWERDLSLVSLQLENILFFYIGCNPNTRQHSFIRNILHTLPDYIFFGNISKI